MTPTRGTSDPDALLVRNAARRVGLSITLGVTVLVVAVLIAALAVVFTQIPPGDLFSPGTHETVVDIGGLDLIVWGVVIGLAAVLLAGTLSVFVTRRAVAPLVDALRRQRRFVADASHELRTPLAIVDARIQVLARELPTGHPQQELVAELRNDSRALNAVVSDLLDSIDISPDGPVTPLRVGPAVQSAVAAMRALARDRDVTISTVAVSADLAVAVPETSLHRCLVSLLDNAVKHSPPGRSVGVTAFMQRGAVLISVADQGHGIQGISPDRIFDRFARSANAVDGGGSARTGFGIGLSLVQDTVHRYGGAAFVTTTSAEGTTITLRFPRAALT
ncbi:HAMP domain-containing sensor histidine kinase [Microbacterium sp. 1P10UB]|uniref:sensor histidine kinase n=1 Tax=unclassified Microbacterium TaxID=2609290 RepID=UPI0039A3205A